MAHLAVSREAFSVVTPYWHPLREEKRGSGGVTSISILHLITLMSSLWSCIKMSFVLFEATLLST